MQKLIILAAAAALLVACKKEDKTEPAPAPATTPAAGTPAAGTPAGTPAAGTTPTDPAAKAVEPTGTTPAMPAAGGPRPASITDAHIATADKLVGVMTELGGALTAAGTDCKKAAAAISAAAPKMKAIEAEGEAMRNVTQNDKAAQQWFMANYVPKLMAPMAPMQQLSQTCKDDPDFNKALSESPMPGRKVKAADPGAAPAPTK